MKSRRLNMCFSNPEVIRLIEQSGNERPSAVIHDLVLKGLLLEKLLLNQVVQDIQLNATGAINNHVPVKQNERQPVSMKQEIKPEPPKPEIKPEIIQVSPAEEYPAYNPNCLGDLGMDF